MGRSTTRHQWVYNSKQWWPLRQRALRRDNWRCRQCGESVKGKGQARVDHIQTVEARPDLAFHLGNLRTLCTKCDAARHSEKGGGVAADRKQIGNDGWPVE